MRRRLALMENWTFIKEGQQETVNLPHTWNAIDGADGGNDYYRGACTYVKQVASPNYDGATERVFLEFDGVNASATVILNDCEIGRHDGGYSTFRIDVTDYIGEENTLQVVVDNSVNTRVYPQKADFTFYGGIYREVNWLVVNKSHFDVLEYGTPGVHVTPTLRADGSAVIGVRAGVDIDDADEYMVRFVLLDAEGRMLAQTSVDVEHSTLTADASFELANPHLWDGLADPYLYSMACILYKGTTEIDAIGADFGVRSIAIDPNQGFILNGRPYPLKGVARHQDRKGMGNAISHQMMEEDMSLIKEVGANCIRLAHYQHSQYFYDLCDREGMIVWAEIPYISEYLEDGDDNSESQMKELIIQNYNHPCIVTWGISNEITIGYRKSKGNNIANHKRLNDLVHNLDPSRPTSMACFAMCTPFHPVTRITDVIGWNLYLGWYVPGMFLNDMFMGFFHTIRPKKPLCYSEYGAEGMPNLHSKRPKRGDNTEEYQCIYHEYMLRCFERHPYLWGTFLWNMFDFAADARNQGGEPGMNHKGLVTFDRKTKKDSFYLYKAYWSDEPFVHIAGKRFVFRDEKQITVKVYSNQPQLALYIGQELVEKKSGDKVFEFVIPIEAETTIRVAAGGYADEACFRYDKAAHPEYELSKKKDDATANWM